MFQESANLPAAARSSARPRPQVGQGASHSVLRGHLSGKYFVKSVEKEGITFTAATKPEIATTTIKAKLERF